MNSYLESIKTTILEGQFYRITFVGDSITSTEWVHPNWREIVEYVLKEELTAVISDWKIPSWKIRCFNCGYDGSTTNDLLAIADEGILINKPNMVLLMVGDNDVHLEETTPEEYKSNILELIQKLNTAGVDKVIVLTPPQAMNKEINSKFIPYLNELKNLSSEKRIVLIDIWKEFEELDLKRFFTFKSLGNEVMGMKYGDIDFLHPNQLGNAYIGKVVLKQVFGINFDPEKYINTTLEGLMYPEY